MTIAPRVTIINSRCNSQYRLIHARMLCRGHLETLTQMIGIIVLDWVQSHLAHSANLLYLLLIYVHGLVVAVAGLVHLVFGVLVWRNY